MVVEERRAYTKVTLDLSTARTDEPYQMEGDFIIVQSLTGSCEIKLNEKTNDPVDLTVFSTIKSPFDRFFITNAAQSGKECILMIGRAAAFETEEVPPGTKWWDGTVWQKWSGREGGSPYVAVGDREATDWLIFDNLSVPGLATVTHAGIDVSGVQSMTFCISTTQNSTVYLQFSDDNATWYDLKAVDDTDRTWNCNNERICVHGDIAAHYMRMVVKNESTSTMTLNGRIMTRR